MIIYKWLNFFRVYLIKFPFNDIAVKWHFWNFAFRRRGTDFFAPFWRRVLTYLNSEPSVLDLINGRAGDGSVHGHNRYPMTERNVIIGQGRTTVSGTLSPCATRFVLKPNEGYTNWNRSFFNGQRRLTLFQKKKHSTVTRLSRMTLILCRPLVVKK